MTYTDLIPELSEIARNAGAAIMEIYANCEGVEIIKKSR
jgi:hypothetical protein